MTIDDELRALAQIPRPTAPPFWSSRVTATATSRLRGATKTPLSVLLYWIVVTALAGPFVLVSWDRLAVLAAILVAVRCLAAVTRHGATTRADPVRRPAR
jgi:hypothetical protein